MLPIVSFKEEIMFNQQLLGTINKAVLFMVLVSLIFNLVLPTTIINCYSSDGIAESDSENNDSNDETSNDDNDEDVVKLQQRIIKSINIQKPEEPDTVNVMVKGIDGEVECLEGYEDQVAEEMEEQVAYPVEDCDEWQGYITQYTDLRNRETINVYEMDYIINYWLKLNGCKDSSPYKDSGQAFIDVSKTTGLDPIFLLALAANESGWEVSSLHRSKNNPYSINMTDTNPGNGYYLGDTYFDGIIGGGVWIYENYYQKGCTTLNGMIYKKMYSSAKDAWINKIIKTMNKSYSKLYEYKEKEKR
jgi:beta-N-acetylglucosaminidase